MDAWRGRGNVNACPFKGRNSTSPPYTVRQWSRDPLLPISTWNSTAFSRVELPYLTGSSGAWGGVPSGVCRVIAGGPAAKPRLTVGEASDQITPARCQHSQVPGSAQGGSGGCRP